MDPVLEQLLYGSIPQGVPQGNLMPIIKPWKPRPNVTLGPDLQFHPVESVDVQSPDNVVKQGFAKVMGLPRELMDEGAREVGLIGPDQTVGGRLAQDILRPESELGAYIQEQAAAGDRTAKNYIAGVEGATEGLVDPLNIALAPLGGPGALAIGAVGLPGMAEGVKQAAESPEADREANLIRSVAGIAAPMGLGAMFGAGHSGNFGEQGRQIDIPAMEMGPETFSPVAEFNPGRQDMATAPQVEVPPTPESLPTLSDETRFSDAIAAVKAIENVEANPISELNTNVWLANRPPSVGMEAAHDIMQAPGALKAKSFMDALNSVTGEGIVDLGIGDSRSNQGGWVQGFQGEPGRIGAVNPDINQSPAAVAHRLLEGGVSKEHLVDRFYQELGRTTVHEGTHTGQKIPGAEGPVDKLFHGDKEFGELRIGDEAPESLSQNQAFDFLDFQRQAEFQGVRDNLVALHKSSPDALTVEDIYDLANRHDRHAELLNSPKIGQAEVFSPVESLAEPTTLSEKLRVAEARDLLRTGDMSHWDNIQDLENPNLQDVPANTVSEDAIDTARLLRNSIKDGSVTDQATWTQSLPEHLQPHAADIWESVSDYVKVNENPANLLSGEKLAKLTPEQLKTFGRLATMDPKDILSSAHDPVEAAKLIVAAKHPGSPAETKALLAQQLMQQHGIKTPPPPATPPVPPTKSPLGPNKPPLVETVEDYVGLKQALDSERDQTARQFEHLRELGPQGLKDFEANPTLHPELAKFFDEMLKYQRDYGVPVSELPNYLPHLYEGTPAQLKAYAADITRQMSKLGLRPGHTLARKLASYDVAEKVYGLKPKFNNLADLAGKYRYMAEKAVADRQLFDFAKRNELISTVKKEGWVELPNFPVRHVETKSGAPVEIKYFGEPKFAKYINRALGQASSIAQILSHITGFGRNIALGAGIPGTGWNGYGLILANRFVDSNPTVAEGIGRVMYAAKDLTMTKAAGKKFEAMLDEVPDAIRHGLNLMMEDRHYQADKRGLRQRVSEAEPLKIGLPSVEESRLGKFALKKLSQTGELVSTFFDRPLTQQVMPLWKMTVYKAAVKKFLAEGLVPKQAKIKAAEWANTVMTGINWQRMGYSPEAMAWSRVIFLAPDILHSNLRLGHGVVKSLLTDPKAPQAKLYRRYAGTAFTLFVAQQFLSKALTGRTAIDAPPGQAFNMYLGDSDKEHEMYLRPSLTANDWARLPFEMASAIASGDERKPIELLKNRRSTLLNWAAQFWDQRDFAGRPISGPGIPAGRSLLNNVDLFTQMARPPQIDMALEALKHVEPVGKLFKEYGMGRIKDPLEIASGLAELPVSFVKKRKKKTEPIGLFDLHKSNRKKSGSSESYATDNF